MFHRHEITMQNQEINFRRFNFIFTDYKHPYNLSCISAQFILYIPYIILNIPYIILNFPYILS